MARKKTAAELAEDVRKLEKRLAKAKEQEHRQSKAEEARKNADIIKAVRDLWAALPQDERPEWDDMPGYIRGQIVTRRAETTEAGSQEGHYYF